MSSRFVIASPRITNENRMSVYKLSFDCGMFYIGSSINLERRITQYRYNLYNRHDINKKVKAVLNSHISAKIEIIETCLDEKSLRGQEDYHIKSNWDNPYLLNRSMSAYSNRSKKNKDESYASGNYMRGRKMSQDVKDKISATTKGKIFSEETRKKISAATTGRKFTEDHIFKLSIAKKGKPMPEHLKALRVGKTNIMVDKFDLYGTFICTHHSYKEAAESIGSQAGHVGEVVKGKYKSLKGFVFKNHNSESEINK